MKGLLKYATLASIALVAVAIACGTPPLQPMSGVVSNSGESRIAFVANLPFGGDLYSEIYTILPNGTDAKQLTNNRYPDFNPSWSPDGTRIAFSAPDTDGDTEIYTMSSDGIEVRQLTRNHTNEWFPSWSPDGSRVAFVSERAGDSEIYTMSADGTDIRQLTDDESDDWSPTLPSWSPDGSRIAFFQGPTPSAMAAAKFTQFH